MPNLPMPEGLSNPDLECVMLALPPQPVLRYIDPEKHDDLFFGDIPELQYAQGAVAETEAHVTLLFGIHPSPSYRRLVDAVLEGSKMPLITIDHVGHFPSRIDGQDYNCIVAHVAVTPELLEGNARLQILDHTNSYPEYKPHMTLAYIKGDADLDYWIKTLDDVYRGQTIAPTHLDYGDD
ncbi:RNA ligase [Microbacterium phage Pumpernickel]|uniref:RNA ligase n=1 Tax=Microbacterium phage Pumpernickel TaxID=2885983 RepID=A0AAE9C3H2_9CAUD|nr:RNA ligase [Microbacterium phage Pumpernickel]UDL15956.1 RNA ligase [Microbacterium phage Pumpernickel]